MQGLARPWGLNPGSPGHEGGVTAARDSEWRSEGVRSSAMRVSPDSRKRCVDDEQGFAYHRKVPASVWSAGRRPVDHLRKPIPHRTRTHTHRGYVSEISGPEGTSVILR